MSGPLIAVDPLVWCSEKLPGSEKGEKRAGGGAGCEDEDYYKTEEFRVQDLSFEEGRVVLAEISKVRNALSDSREVSGGERRGSRGFKPSLITLITLTTLNKLNKLNKLITPITLNTLRFSVFLFFFLFPPPPPLGITTTFHFPVFPLSSNSLSSRQSAPATLSPPPLLITDFL